MLIDTHCHLDALTFDSDRETLVRRAQALGVSCIVIPAVSPTQFEKIRTIAHGLPGMAYALGIHPWFVQPGKLARVSPESEEVIDLQSADAQGEGASRAQPQQQPDRLAQAIHALAVALRLYRDDPCLVAVGEIGLDGGVPGLDAVAQHYLYTEQLKLARAFDLPVLCHVHRAQDAVLKELRRFGVKQGIAHAFNGSLQQAKAFLAQGFKLGFGGQLTYTRAQRVRRLAVELPLEAIVLETDAPDQPPAWCQTATQNPIISNNNTLSEVRSDAPHASVDSSMRPRNTPAEVARIADTLASLRGVDPTQLALCTTANACAALPNLKRLLP